MKELVVISGKGGTGKTSLVASFAGLADRVVLADCDVDAADLHLILNPVVLRREDYSGGKRARVDVTRCIGCGKCEELCRFDTISMTSPADKEQNRVADISPIACEGCGVCAWFCPAGAMTMEPAINGEWYLSQTRMGPMVHARLGVAEENSGKLVSTVRQAARELAKERTLDLVLIDGSPGMGCPVIASITGADLVLIVVEPTVSGLHDLERVADLIRHFQVSGMVCVNKWDLNPQVSDRIEQFASERGLATTGRVRYSRSITDAQIARKTVVEYTQEDVVQDIRDVWKSVEDSLGSETATNN